MTTKRDYAANITTKGLDGTGLTDDIARKLYHRRGRKCMAIVELVVDETSDKRDGTHKVALAIAGLELVLDNDDIDNHLREVQQTIYYNRSLDEAQPSLDGGDGINPKVSDVIRDGLRHRPHPFLPVDATQDDSICDVCGLTDRAGVHSTQDFLPDGEDDEDESELVDVDPAEPHQFEQGPDDSCLHCGRAVHEDFATDWVDSQHGDQPEAPDDWSYPATEGQVEPVEYDERPNATVIAQGKHIHVAGECIKNRHGAICTPAATIPDPFTAGA